MASCDDRAPLVPVGPVVSKPQGLRGALMRSIRGPTLCDLGKGRLHAIRGRSMVGAHVVLSAGHSTQMSNGFGRLPLASTRPGSGLVRLRRLLWEQEIESSNLSFPTQWRWPSVLRRGSSCVLAPCHERRCPAILSPPASDSPHWRTGRPARAAGSRFPRRPARPTLGPTSRRKRPDRPGLPRFRECCTCGLRYS